MPRNPYHDVRPGEWALDLEARAQRDREKRLRQIARDGGKPPKGGC